MKSQLRRYLVCATALLLWCSTLVACHKPPPPRPQCSPTQGCAAGQVCAQGKCICAPTYGRCDGVCVPLDSSQVHCGKCGNLCDGGRLCVEGQCICSDGETDCGACTNTKTDSSHCGACGTACDGVERCVEGQCCPEHKGTLCDVPNQPGHKQCTDIASNPANCGGCGTTCATGQLCHRGQCQCPAGQRLCGDRCIDPTSDPEDCGKCGNKCGNGEACASGRCVSKCPKDTPDRCGRTCCHTQTHPNHCGKCGNKCGDGTVCRKGRCVCPHHTRSCGTPGRCIDTQRDPAHCGACSNSCARGQRCVEGRCVNQCPHHRPKGCVGGCYHTKKSPHHCGACGISCQGGRLCVEGRCQCPTDTTWCDGRCIDTQSNPIHCGACGTICPTGTLCAKGKCIDACPKDRNATCYGACLDTQSQPNHCGECGTLCLPQQICDGGACRCPKGTALCEDRCIDPQTHPRHCGSCDNTCSAKQVCQRGKCVDPCPSTVPTRCDKTCADTNTDPKNCGECGNKCPDGARCTNGTCQCPTNQTACDNKCTDTRQDPDNCGKCGNKCGPTEACNQSKCSPCLRCLHCAPRACGAQTCGNVAASAGGSTDDIPARIATDKDGNSYLFGLFSKSATFGNLRLTARVLWSYFVAKRDPQGKYLWVKQLDIHGNAPPTPVQGGLALDCHGNIYIAHAFRGRLSAGQLSVSGDGVAGTVFLARLAPTGQFLWLRGSTNRIDASARGLVIDSQNRLFLVGNAKGPIAFSHLAAGATNTTLNPYIVQFSTTGQPMWLKRPYQADSMQVFGMALTPSGQLAVAGRFQHQITLGSQLYKAEYSDAFVGVVSNTGQPAWLQTLGGPGDDAAHDVATDAFGNLYPTGYFQQKLKCGKHHAAHKGSGTFVGKFGPKGTTNWIVSPISQATSRGEAIAIGPKGQVFVTGAWFGSAPIKSGNTTLHPKGESGAFVLRLEPNKGETTWGDNAGGPKAELGTHDISVDPFGNVHTIGCFANTATASHTPITARGRADVLLWKIGASYISP